MSQSSAYKEIHNVFIIAYIVNKGALIQFCFLLFSHMQIASQIRILPIVFAFSVLHQQICN